MRWKINCKLNFILWHFCSPMFVCCVKWELLAFYWYWFYVRCDWWFLFQNVCLFELSNLFTVLLWYPQAAHTHQISICMSKCKLDVYLGVFMRSLLVCLELKIFLDGLYWTGNACDFGWRCRDDVFFILITWKG